MSVKTYQHAKAIGNARKAARGAMVPILRDVTGEDALGQAETDYGPERVAVAFSTISVNVSGGDNILAIGRLERLSAEAVEGDVRLANKEAYRLYWLPFAWTHAEGDYHGNPQAIGNDINPSASPSQNVDFLVSGMRVWIVLDANSLSSIIGLPAHEFVVVDVFRNGIADVVEYEATVIRSEGTVPRTVAAL